MKIYLAGKWEQRQLIKQRMEELKDKFGFEVTWDWTSSDVPLNQDKALLDIQGVEQAKVLIAILEQDLPYKGTWFEIGASYAWKKPTVLIGPRENKGLFGLLPELIHFDTWADFLQACEKGEIKFLVSPSQ